MGEGGDGGRQSLNKNNFVLAVRMEGICFYPFHVIVSLPLAIDHVLRVVVPRLQTFHSLLTKTSVRFHFVHMFVYSCVCGGGGTCMFVGGCGCAQILCAVHSCAY